MLMKLHRNMVDHQPRLQGSPKGVGQVREMEKHIKIYVKNELLRDDSVSPTTKSS